MPEVMFVVKSLVVTIILVLCLQVKLGAATAEDHMQDWIRTSTVTKHLKDVAQGATLAITNAAKMVSTFASDNFGGGNSLLQKQEQKAGRLNFDFKRSAAYEKQQSEKN